MTEETQIDRSKVGKTTAKNEYRLRRGVDKPFLTAIVLLLCAGVVMVASASYVYAGSRYGDNLFFIKRHVLYLLIGVVAMWCVSKIPYEVIRRWSPAIFLTALALLVVVLFAGSSAKGAQRWLYIGPISIQPSEIMKFAVIVVCADYIDRFQAQITLRGQPGSFLKIVLPSFSAIIGGAAALCGGLLYKKLFDKFLDPVDVILEEGTENGYYGLLMLFEKIKIPLILAGILLLAFGLWHAYRKRLPAEAPDFFFGILPFGILIVVNGVLLAMQPHMSGFIIITLLIVTMMTVGGSSARYMLGAIGVGGVGVFGLLNLFSHSKGRLDVWKNPFANLQDGGWQPAQSLYAIGNGGIWGVGIGQSMQKHLYLPEPMNDYIFAIFCEEFGFIGAVAVILLFVFFVYRGVVIAFRAPDRFSSLMVLGITAQVGIQAVLNMMVVTNTIPSTGIALPFFSYGGSALIILLAEMGVVLSVSRYSVIEKK